MGQFLSHPLFLNCESHSLCMRFPQHVYLTVPPSPNRGSASRQIAQISPSFFSSSSSTARAGAAALFASPADIVRRRSKGGLDPIPDWSEGSDMGCSSTLLYYNSNFTNHNKFIRVFIIIDYVQERNRIRYYSPFFRVFNDWTKIPLLAKVDGFHNYVFNSTIDSLNSQNKIIRVFHSYRLASKAFFPEGLFRLCAA